MRLDLTNGLRLIGVLGLAVAIQSMAPQIAASPGRDYPRCLQSCNHIRGLCNDACAGTCQALFPNDPAQRDACVAQCKGACSVQSDECKAICKAIRDGECVGPEP